jgi:hypothetical protein
VFAGKKSIAIGVTGHRALIAVDKITAGVDRALECIDRCFPGRDWSVISSLAEGADRLVVARVLAYKPDAQLVAPLPMSPEQCKASFSSDKSRDEFERLLAMAGQVIPPQTDQTGDEAYLAAGIALLDRIDLLIALWDGQAAQGRGGTGEIVEIARRRGLPLAWVLADNQYSEDREEPSEEGEQGKVVFERFK